ncbi:hypothetical protein ZWY2020_024604 [Hordeum vulgare]|nr:hypothetical protein ZWY2020_024604 [Hordeum vulgare]
MEAVAMSPSSVSSHNLDAASTSDDMPSSQEGLLFSDSLKDLRNLRSQLYSAAEYFEVFYTNNSHRSTLRVEAPASTVDHLGFVSHKVDNLTMKRPTRLMKQNFEYRRLNRVKICQQAIDQEGRSQQSLLIRAPQYHRRYILPGADILESTIHPVSEPTRYSRQHTGRKMRKSQSAMSTPVSRQTTMRSIRSQSPTVRETHHRSRSMSLSQKHELNHHTPSHELESKRNKSRFANTNSSQPSRRSATVARRPPLIQSILCSRTMKTRKSGRKDRAKVGLLKSLLTRRRWRNDESLYNYLDEY